MLYTDANGIKPHSPCVMIDHGHPCARGLVGAWEFAEHGGRRWCNAVTEKTAVFSSTSYPGRWTMTQAGMAIDVLESDSTGQNIQHENPVAGLDRATFGCMIVPQITRTSSPFSGAAVVNSVGSGPKWKVSSNGNIDDMCRIDFIPNTAYARPSTGQLTLGQVYVLFATWISGTQPKVFKGVYPGGLFSEFTYNDRGSASGTIGTSNYYLGLDGAFEGRMTLLWLRMWNRPLPEQEMRWLHRFPWDIWQDDASLWLAESAAAWAARIQHGGAPARRVF